MSVTETHTLVNESPRTAYVFLDIHHWICCYREAVDTTHTREADLPDVPSSRSRFPIPERVALYTPVIGCSRPGEFIVKRNEIIVGTERVLSQV